MQAQKLNVHKWENRVIVIQTQNLNSKQFKSQLKEFKNSKEEMKERKLVVYHLVDQEYQFTDFKSEGKNEINRVTTNDFLNSFKVKEGFNLTLIGLDGGVKLERTEPIKISELFQVIDAMPMRRMELRY